MEYTSEHYLFRKFKNSSIILSLLLKLIIFNLMFFLHGCCFDKRYDIYGNLYFKYLERKQDVDLDLVSSSIGILIPKKGDYCMYLGDQKYTGSVVKYYENDQICFIGSYSEGKATGEWTYYYENGKIKHIVNYEYDKVKSIKEYDQMGNLSRIQNNNF